QMAAAVEAGRTEQRDQRRPAGQRAARHVDPVDLVGHRDRVPGELPVEALLLLLPLPVALGVLLLRPEQLPVALLALAVVPGLLLRHAVTDRAVSLYERVRADGGHTSRGEHADQRELPGEVADQ